MARMRCRRLTMLPSCVLVKQPCGCIKINLISHAGSTSRQQYSLQGHEAAGGDVGTVLIHGLSRQP